VFCRAGVVSFILSDWVHFVDRNVLKLEICCYDFLFDWILLLFMGIVLMIYSLLILYSDEHMSSDLRIIIRHG
jgi:hypothetical protein